MQSDNIGQHSITQSFRLDSKIATNPKELTDLKGFFRNKIKSLKLLYRASQNDFLASKFHEKCDNINSTLVLVETQFGKKIGGYTFLKWNEVPDGSFAMDFERRSFLFSLTHNQKLKINVAQSEYEICNYSGCGPLFGNGRDFGIGDKSNINSSCISCVGSTYVNENYKWKKQQTSERFSGQKNKWNFKTKQWQVYQVEFQEKFQ